MNLDASHIKDLHIFLAVVDANGITNAQGILNKDASTISRAITSLETRLGLKLCERGRQGFRLTQEGEVLLEETIKLFSSFRTFEHRIERMGGKGSGKLVIGIIDNIITDENCSLARAISEISSYFENEVHIDLIVKNPYDLEKYLLDKQIDIAIGIFENRHDAITYTPLYNEIDQLYCSSESVIGQLICNHVEQLDLIHTLRTQKFVARTFLNKTDIHDTGFQIIGELSFTNNIEAIAFMLLSGEYIGFLPTHYAKRYVDTGRLIPVLADSIFRTSNIVVAFRKNEDKTRNLISKSLEFIQDM